MSDPNLSPLHLRILEIEAQQWKYQGAKDAAIRSSLGLDPIRHAQILNALLDDPRALAYDAQLVRRLQRLRSVRRRNRIGLRAV